ncbi:MAG: Holliday junction resolvase [Thermoplasmata archaeon]
MVGHSFGGYERALRGLLSGDTASVKSYARALPPEARPGFERLISEPFLVVRAAGSFGFDLVALRREFAFPIEVKASSDSVIRFTAASGRASEQLEAHRAAVARVGLMVIYAYRRLGIRGEECWRLFLEGTRPKGAIVGYVFQTVPLISRTREGNGILRWEEGMPLSHFVGRVHSVLQPTYGTGA